MTRQPEYVRVSRERRKRVEDALDDGRVICDRCGATLWTYAEKCTADLADACPGFQAIERAAGNLGDPSGI